MVITKIYLVGDETSPKTNNWLQVTNCLKTAEKALEAIKGGTLKCVNVGTSKIKGDK